MTSVDLSPIRRSIVVPWTADKAFHRFTAEFSAWWPRYTHSIGGRRVKRVVMECRVGGAIYEEHTDGTRYRWGTVTALEPSRRVAFTFHAAFAETEAQQVEVTFDADGTGTRVTLVSSGWERMTGAALRSRGGYRIGWGGILGRFAGRLTRGELLFYGMAWAIDGMGGRRQFMRNSLGRIPADDTRAARPT
jgi:uncharacterized protein YndB with AHSA1/START domain